MEGRRAAGGRVCRRVEEGVENQALQSVVNELCTMAQLGSKIRADVLSGTVPRALYNSWVQQCLPDKKFMANWKRMMLVNFSIEQRQSPDDSLVSTASHFD